MWIWLASALALPLPRLPDGEEPSAWVEPWSHAGLTDQGALDVSVHLLPAAPDRWRLQVRRDGAAVREVEVPRPASAQDREELAFLASGLLREIDEADARRPLAPLPLTPPPPVAPPTVAPTPPPAPRPSPAAAPVFDVHEDATLWLARELPLPTGAAARHDPELDLPDLDPDSLLEPEPAPRLDEAAADPSPPRRFQFADLTLLGGAAMADASIAPAARFGLRAPLWTRPHVMWTADLGVLPRTRWFDTPQVVVTTVQVESRLGLFVRHPWLVAGAQVGMASRHLRQDWDTVDHVLVPQISSVTGARIGRVHVELELLSDLLRVDARMPDQRLRTGSRLHLRANVGFTFGRRGDPKPEVVTSLGQNEETL